MKLTGCWVVDNVVECCKNKPGRVMSHDLGSNDDAPKLILGTAVELAGIQCTGGVA